MVGSGAGRVVILFLQSADQPASETSPLDVAQALTALIPQTFPIPVPGAPTHPPLPRDHWPSPRLFLCLPFLFRPLSGPCPPGSSARPLPGLPLQVLAFCFTRDSASSFSPEHRAEGQSLPPAWPCPGPSPAGHTQPPRSLVTSQPLLEQHPLPGSASLLPAALSGCPHR